MTRQEYDEYRALLDAKAQAESVRDECQAFLENAGPTTPNEKDLEDKFAKAQPEFDARSADVTRFEQYRSAADLREAAGYEELDKTKPSIINDRGDVGEAIAARRLEQESGQRATNLNRDDKFFPEIDLMHRSGQTAQADAYQVRTGDQVNKVGGAVALTYCFDTPDSRQRRAGSRLHGMYDDLAGEGNARWGPNTSETDIAVDLRENKIYLIPDEQVAAARERAWNSVQTHFAAEGEVAPECYQADIERRIQPIGATTERLESIRQQTRGPGQVNQFQTSIYEGRAAGKDRDELVTAGSQRLYTYVTGRTYAGPTEGLTRAVSDELGKRCGDVTQKTYQEACGDKYFLTGQPLQQQQQLQNLTQKEEVEMVR